MSDPSWQRFERGPGIIDGGEDTRRWDAMTTYADGIRVHVGCRGEGDPEAVVLHRPPLREGRLVRPLGEVIADFKVLARLIYNSGRPLLLNVQVWDTPAVSPAIEAVKAGGIPAERVLFSAREPACLKVVNGYPTCLIVGDDGAPSWAPQMDEAGADYLGLSPRSFLLGRPASACIVYDEGWGVGSGAEEILALSGGGPHAVIADSPEKTARLAHVRDLAWLWGRRLCPGSRLPARRVGVVHR